MRKTRVKPPGITTPAYASRHVFRRIAGWTAAVLVALMFFVPLYQWSTGPKTSSSPPSRTPLVTPLGPASGISGIWCTGNPVRGFTLRAKERRIVNWGDYCHVDLKVVVGLMEIGSVGPQGFKTVGPDGLGELDGFPIVEFRALTDVTVNYVLCPSGTKWTVNRCA